MTLLSQLGNNPAAADLRLDLASHLRSAITVALKDTELAGDDRPEVAREMKQTLENAAARLRGYLQREGLMVQ